MGNGGPGRSRTYDQVIMSHLDENDKDLESQDLHSTTLEAPNPAPNFSPKTAPEPGLETRSDTLDAEGMLAVIAGMSEADRQKLISALVERYEAPKLSDNENQSSIS